MESKYKDLPIGVSPGLLELIRQEAKAWERRAERLEKDWEYEKRRADRLQAALAPFAAMFPEIANRGDGKYGPYYLQWCDLKAAFDESPVG